MRRKNIVLSLLLLVVVALMTFAPAAFAGRVTRIMLAQENVDVYMYKATTGGDFTCSLIWKNADDSTGPTYPAGSVNVILQTVYPSEGPGPYQDVDAADLYDVDMNPVSNSGTPLTLVADQEVWVTVNPYIGDYKYTLTTNFTGTGQWYGKDGAQAPVSTKTTTTDGWAYGVGGEVYVRTIGDWYSCGQYWPGDEALDTALTNWSIYVSDRADYVSGYWPEWTYAYTWTSGTAKLWTGNGEPSSSGTNYSNLKTANVNMWYAVDPQTWSALKVPNEFPAGTGFIYGKPGSITFQQAPLWYTYSFMDAAATKPGYTWGSVSPASVTDWSPTNPNAPSKRSYTSSSGSASTITWRFQGNDFSWVYSKGVKGGINSVKVDGVAGITPKGEIDQFNATFVYKQKTDYNLTTDFGIAAGATDAWHTVVVTGTGRTNSTSVPAQRFIYHDAFIDPDDVTPYAENNYDGQTLYTWDLVTPTTPPTGLSGTSYTSTKDSSCGMAFTFNCADNSSAGRKLVWTYLTGVKGGIQNVYLDGLLIDKVNQFSAAFTAGLTKTYTDQVATSYGVTVQLPKGLHTIFITGSGQTDSTTVPAQRFIYHDAFQAEAQAKVEE